MTTWRCPHCGTPQEEAARCWVCRRSSTTCATCRHAAAPSLARVVYCGLDPRRTPIAGDEHRGCWPGVRSRRSGRRRGRSETATTGGELAAAGSVDLGLWVERKPGALRRAADRQGTQPGTDAGSARMSETALPNGADVPATGSWFATTQPAGASAGVIVPEREPVGQIRASASAGARQT